MSLLYPSAFQPLSDYSLGDNAMSPKSPSEVVDLGNDAVDLAFLLSHLSHFLGGARKLLTCHYLLPKEFHRHSRKIVRLVEIAHGTLIAANILPFASFCYSSPFRPHKSAYITLLRLLYDHRHHVDAALQDRVNRLLQPLFYKLSRARGVCVSAVTQERWIAASPEGRPGRVVTASMQRSLKRPYSKPAISSESDSTLMPPPDKFPGRGTKYHGEPQADRRSNKQLWDPEIFLSANGRKKRRRNSHDEDKGQENRPIDAELESPQLTLKLRPLSRRFGIYCTGKTTMHRQNERAGRPGGTTLI